MVIGYFAIIRANRTIEDVLEAPELDRDDTATEPDEPESGRPAHSLTARAVETIQANDIAIQRDGSTADGIVRFHAALCEMTGRRGIRNEISRYEAMTIALIEPKGDQAGCVFPGFPPDDSPLRLEPFFQTLYRRYEERFVYGAPLLADRGLTTRLQWDPIHRCSRARNLEQRLARARFRGAPGRSANAVTQHRPGVWPAPEAKGRFPRRQIIRL